MKTTSKLIMFLMLSSSALANDIYVTQSGNNLVLDITQQGTGNTIGTLNLPSSLTGAGTDFIVSQVGNTNELTFEVNGNNYTGNFDVTGNSNVIDFKCDSGNSSAGCDNVTATITLSGSSNTVNLNIGENDDSTGTQATITTTGDSNIITADIDSPNAEFNLSITGSTNTFGLTMDGVGVGEHKSFITHTGDGGTFLLSQSGVNNKVIDLTTIGDNHSVTITQQD
jgi:hypothetical protein